MKRMIHETEIFIQCDSRALPGTMASVAKFAHAGAQIQLGNIRKPKEIAFTKSFVSDSQRKLTNAVRRY